MSTTLPLPGGGTATLRDPQLVTERHRRPVTRLQMRLAASSVGDLLTASAAQPTPESEEAFAAAAKSVLGSDDFQLLDEVNDALVVALVETVQLTPDAPVLQGLTLDSLLDLPGSVYDVLRREAAKHVAELIPSFAISPDEASPTPPSAA